MWALISPGMTSLRRASMRDPPEGRSATGAILAPGRLDEQTVPVEQSGVFAAGKDWTAVINSCSSFNPRAGACAPLCFALASTARRRSTVERRASSRCSAPDRSGGSAAVELIAR